MPELQREMVRRPRLLDLMASRHQRVATIISADAGFGKSTLLAQTIHDPLDAGRSHTIFHRIGTRDHDGSEMTASLSAQIALVASGHDASHAIESRPEISLADQLWHLSPLPITVVIDDYHHLPAGAAGWTALNDLIGDLPDNANIVVSGRGGHELKLARLIARGEAVDITEDMLAFTADELDEFAALRRVERNTLDEHGWPALVELEARAGIAGAHEFVAEEVIAQLDPDRVDALRRAAVHEIVDDGLVAAVTDFDGTADDLLTGLPLISPNGDGTWAMHDLWRKVLVDGLTTAERRSVLTQVATELQHRGRLRDALIAAIDADADDVALDVLVAFARDLPLRHSIDDRRAIVALLPDSLATSAEAEMLRADIMFASEPTLAAEPLQRSIDVATKQNRPEVTVLALLRLGDLAYRSGHRDGLVETHERLSRLAALGGTGADAGVVLAESWLLLLDNKADIAIEMMRSPVLQSYRPVAEMVDYYRAVQLGQAGRCSASLEVLRDLARIPDARIARRMGGFAALMTWWSGELDADDRRAALELTEQIGADRQVHLYVEAMATASLFSASAGDVPTARSVLSKAVAHRDRIPAMGWGVITVEIATAVLDLVDGHEDRAAERLEQLVPDTGPFNGFGRHVFGNAGALIYALVPRTRPFFDDEVTGPDLSLATEVGRALVALRERNSTEPAARLPWDDLARIRTWAYEPHLAELAIAAMSSGSIRARIALASLVHDPRASLRTVADRHGDPVRSIAKAELSDTPHRPSETVRVSVLGPTAVTFGDEPLTSAVPIKRTMVRELLLLLVDRRTMRRDEIGAALWPDKDETSARNNLRATLNHLRQLLEVAGDDSAPPWQVRSDGDSITLFDSDRLDLDVDRFRSAMAAARRAERDRNAGDALAHYRTALKLYRGPYLADALDPDWAANERTVFHLDMVEAATRASELSLGRGDLDDALAFARRAVDAEELSERAHRALIRALIAADDRAAAVRAHDRVVEVLAADGLRPDDETLRLRTEI